MGSGRSILANSRPYEGMGIEHASSDCVADVDHQEARAGFKVKFRLHAYYRCRLAFAAGLALTGYFFWRLTGIPWLLAVSGN